MKKRTVFKVRNLKDGANFFRVISTSQGSSHQYVIEKNGYMRQIFQHFQRETTLPLCFPAHQTPSEMRSTLNWNNFFLHEQIISLWGWQKRQNKFEKKCTCIHSHYEEMNRDFFKEVPLYVWHSSFSTSEDKSVHFLVIVQYLTLQ